MSQQMVLMTLHIPRALVQACGTPEQVRQHLAHEGLWPATARLLRWAIDPLAQGYLVELAIDIRLPDTVSPP